ncbi:uncharacterized protein LOC116109038 [Pistacia vera]|uniref:uncharacterized protein LOC116109038 n=1 Tax=Pistacia vera TaxID=55513 RepID=UPI0012634B9D|nr:uncharacterized protein LOC116109038 [Pistacia vera]XP_031251152.1 uncharacterized protein LOC116109038 [Pistacia vera]XP_031251153.1 uncharacterized protein LOC116109038 [Pistacia vera]
MASLSLCRWSVKTAADSSAIELSTDPCNYPVLFFCQSKRRRFVASAAHNSSSSSSSSSGSNASSISKKRIELDVYSSSQRKIVDNSKNEVVLASRKRRTISFKSLFGRRSLWRRILFASKKVRSIILLNVITVIYASNIPVLKEVEAIVDPAAFNAMRFAVSAIPFIPFMLQARDDVETRNAGIELGFWVSLGYLMQALGLITSDAGRASFISMFTVIVVPLLDSMLGAIVPAWTWFGAVMSVVGVAMLESSGSPPSVGDLLNFLSAVFFGVHMLRTEHISRSTSKKNFLPLLGYEVCVIALFSVTWYFVDSWFGSIQSWDPSSLTWAVFWDLMVAFPWIPALYTGIFSTGLCLWIEMAAMRDVSATETAIIYGLEPVWGAGFAWFLLGERWGAIGWLGAFLVLGGSLTVQLFGSSSPSDSIEDEERSKKGDQVEKGLSTSPVVISPREDVPKL